MLFSVRCYVMVIHLLVISSYLYHAASRLQLTNTLFEKRKKFLPENLTTYSMGMFVLFFGTKKQYPNIAHHSIWLGKRFKSLLKDIFDNKILSEDFSLYIHRPTATDQSFAPKGCDSFYVLCPVPNLQGNVNWSVEGIKLQTRIIKALEQTILPNLQENISDEFFMTPVDFKNNYRSTHGAGFSIAPNFSQSAWFRYHNKDPHINNLYFSAAGAHPGAGGRRESRGRCQRQDLVSRGPAGHGQDVYWE